MRRALPAAVLAALLLPAAADAAFPGSNGRIAYQGYRSLGTINASGGDRTPLIAEDVSGRFFSSPVWSADGQRLAFVTNRDGNAEIYTTGPSGTPLTRITNNAAEDGTPTWSPDGTKIAFESNRDTGVTGRTQLYVMNADGTGVVNLSTSPQDDGSPAWSPDGSKIAFARGPQDGNHDIWVTSSAGGAGVPLTNSPVDEDHPDWSPDGSRIVFQRGNSGSPAAVVVMGADGGGQAPLPLPGDATNPVWSPDGTRIAYAVEPELFSAAPDGSGATQLTFGGSATLFARSPSWQPIPVPGGGGPPPPPTGPVDGDGDGVSPPLDCNDANPAVRPGAKDIRGDKVDQDCVGGDALAVLRRSLAGITATYPISRYTAFTSISVAPARKGDRLRLTCKGKGCDFKRKAIRVKKNARTVSLMKHVRGMKLRKGTVVQLRVTRAGWIGRAKTWKVRAPKIPKITDRCVRPGAKKLIRCPRG
jgi:Tol biopolymer transport system component